MPSDFTLSAWVTVSSLSLDCPSVIISARFGALCRSPLFDIKTSSTKFAKANPVCVPPTVRFNDAI